VVSRGNGRSIIAALLVAAAALAAFLAVLNAGRGPFGLASAAGDGSLPVLKGEMGDFSYFAGPKPVPPISFEDGQGKTLNLADFKGRVVLVNFWATWCAPCKSEMPSLDRLEAALGGSDFIVLDISLDRQGRAAVEPYFRDNELAHLGIYIDREGKGFRAWQGSGVPTSFIIGRDGLARGVLIGAADWDSPAAIKLIRHFISEGRAQKIEETRASMPRPRA
jgi:thiol-disulfide isomerase/thioredoxin